MSMGVVSSDDFERELANLNGNNVQHKQLPTKGRGATNAIPETLRKVISEEAIEGTPHAELSKIFGVSESSVSAYKNGATSTSTYNKPNSDLRARNNVIRDRILGKARNTLIRAIDNITDEKLENSKLRDVASVASAMAAVIDRVSPKIESNISVDKLVIYQPRQREEQSYEVIDVQE